MSAKRSTLGNGFVPNLVRLSFLMIAVWFLFGPMTALFDSKYQWLSFLIGGLLVASLITAVFFRWKISLPTVLAFLAANIFGWTIVSSHNQAIETRAAYVTAAVSAEALEDLFPQPIRDWLDTFETGHVGFAAIDERKIGEARQRISTRPKGRRPLETSLYYLEAKEPMTDQEFIDSYQVIAREHGDWLGYTARYIQGGGKRVPLIMPRSKEALETSERTQRSICRDALADQAFGINIEEASQDYLNRLGISDCDENANCQRLKQSLRFYDEVFFPNES